MSTVLVKVTSEGDAARLVEALVKKGREFGHIISSDTFEIGVKVSSKKPKAKKKKKSPKFVK